MAEQAVGSVASAVVGQITDRTLSTVLRKLRTPATTHEKLQRLEMLLLRIRSAIEVSEKHAIESSSLIQWRQKLREAAEEGGQVLRGFQQRARDDEAARNAAAAAATAAEEQQGCGNSSSSAGGSVATGASVAVSFTWSALSGMARRMHGATRALFYSDEDMEKLNSSLERLEKLSPDIQEFVILLHLEVSPKLEQRPAKRMKQTGLEFKCLRKAGSAIRSTLTLPRQRSACRTKKEADASDSVVAQMMDISLAENGDALVKEKWELTGMLRQVLAGMGRAAKMVDERNLEDLVWMARWAAVLREAERRGNVVVGNVFSGSDVDGRAGRVTADDLYLFARTVDWLAWGMPCFNFLVDEAARQHANDQQQQQEEKAGRSSSTSVSTTALSPTRKALSGMDSTVEALEKPAANIGKFIALLQLETSPELKRACESTRKVSHNAVVAPEVAGVSLAEPTESRQLLMQKRALVGEDNFHNAAVIAEVDGALLAEATESREIQELEKRLREAMLSPSPSKRRDIKSMKWLAHGADVLAEARQQGFKVLETLVLKDILKCDIETDQLRSFVHTMGSLAEMRNISTG
uniref:Rx N-terminal domain-containing protein n=1 Tax=Oryza brachyantha TaxID=4533 RepID=J3LU88_ORYBR